VVVEAALHREERGLVVAEMPLADDLGPVADVMQRLRNRALGERQSAARPRAEHVGLESHAHRKAPREQRGAGGRAHRERISRFGVATSFDRKPTSCQPRSSARRITISGPERSAGEQPCGVISAQSHASAKNGFRRRLVDM
jgi:hypothetical protein